MNNPGSSGPSQHRDPSAGVGATAVACLASVRIRGFRGISDVEIAFDSVTTIIGEDGATKAGLVEMLDRCLGPGPDDPPAFTGSDFTEPRARGAPRSLRAWLEFVEAAPGTWRAREPDLAKLAKRGRDGRLVLGFVVGAEQKAGAGSPRIEAFVDVADRVSRASPDAIRRAWVRLRALSPVLVLAADRWGRERVGKAPAAGSGPQAEIARLCRRIVATHGRLSEEDLESARAVLRDEMRLGVARPAPAPRERAIVDVLDSRRISQHDVTDDAVQDILLRLLRAGLMLEAQRQGRVRPEASPIIVVDSPDARLHPTLTARVWRFVYSVATQVIVTTNSSEVVAASPLRGLRRLVRRDDRVDVTRVVPSEFSLDDLRRVIYHVRLRRGNSLLSRAWFLLEGETEVWIVSEFASMLGYSFAAEGVACIEFAQCGLAPLVRLADQLGIGWHVLADGDEAGVAYAGQARSRLRGRSPAAHVTMLGAPDIENLLYESGYADVYRKSAGRVDVGRLPQRAIIRRALARGSKPLLAIRVIERAVKSASPGVPGNLAAAIHAVVGLARKGTKGR